MGRQFALHFPGDFNAVSEKKAKLKKSISKKKKKNPGQLQA